MDDQPTGKIHADEEWKAKVEAEKQIFAAEEKLKQKPDERPALPPASLAMLVTNFATQALVSLGRIADPTGEQRPVDLEMARYAIDMLGVLEEKTKGNLEQAEEQLLSTTLHDLRMTFLSVSRTAETAGGEGGGDAGEQRQGRIIMP